MFTASAEKSPTSDERPHIAAGLSYLALGTIELNPEHPPLLKELSAFFLILSGVRWPETMPAGIENAPPPDQIWILGDSIIVRNGVDSVMFWSRLPMILIAAMLGLVIYVWGGQLIGKTAALFALFLYVFNPIILAHSYLVTTDVGFAAFAVLFLFTLWRYLEHPSWRRLIGCGLALGAAMCAKFSGIVLPPLAIALIVAYDRWPPASAPKTPTVGRRLLAVLVMFATAFVVMQIVYLFSSNPFLYFANYFKIYPWENPNYLHFMAGKFATHFYSYLLVAYLLKETLPGIVLTVTGLVLVLRGQVLSKRVKAFVLLTPAIFWLGYTMNGKNIGVRYIIPVLPFCCLLAGFALTKLLEAKPIWKRAAAVLLCSWVLIAAAGIYPDHLSYFNEAACLFQNPKKIGLDGGSRCGTYWLDDSNVDWGQGLKELKTWLDRNAARRPIYLANFSGLPAESYGIRYTPVDFNRDLLIPQHGLYVVSAHYVARIRAELPPDPAVGAWLRREPDAVVGHAYYVYDLQ